MAAVEGRSSRILESCIDIGGLWMGRDEHGWTAQMMAEQAGNTFPLHKICGNQASDSPRPVPSTALEVFCGRWSRNDGSYLGQFYVPRCTTLCTRPKSLWSQPYPINTTDNTSTFQVPLASRSTWPSKIHSTLSNYELGSSYFEIEILELQPPPAIIL
jgi:hypothetical protein